MVQVFIDDLRARQLVGGDDALGFQFLENRFVFGNQEPVNKDKPDKQQDDAADQNGFYVYF
jgi:hypothetical protein